MKQHYPKHPIREVLRLIVGKRPPDFVQGYSLKTLTDQQYFELQQWCLNNEPLGWLTGSGIIEVAETLVGEAVGNANIPREEDNPRAKKR